MCQVMCMGGYVYDVRDITLQYFEIESFSQSDFRLSVAQAAFERDCEVYSSSWRAPSSPELNAFQCCHTKQRRIRWLGNVCCIIPDVASPLK